MVRYRDERRKRCAIYFPISFLLYASTYDCDMVAPTPAPPPPSTFCLVKPGAFEYNTQRVASDPWGTARGWVCYRVS